MEIETFMALASLGLLALAVAAFVYRKRLAQFFIGSSWVFVLAGVVVFPEQAEAQATLSSPPPRSVPDYRPLAEKTARIIPRPGLLGFELAAEVEEAPENCQEALSPFYLSAFVLADISDEDLYLQVNRCLKESLPNAGWVMSIGPLRVPLTGKEKRMVEKLRKKLADQRRTFKAAKQALELDLGRKTALSEATRLLRKLNKGQGPPADLAGMALYSRLGNTGKALSLAGDYLRQSEYAVFFNLEYPYKEAESLRDLVTSHAASLDKEARKSKVYQAMLLKLFGEASVVHRDEMKDRLEVPSDAQAASLTRSPLIGKSYPLAWIWHARKQLKPRDLERLLETVPAAHERGSLQILRYYLPLSPRRRKEFAAGIAALAASPHPQDRVMLFEIMENDSWRKYLSSLEEDGFFKDQHFKDQPLKAQEAKRNVTGPLFKNKREFYTGSFRRNEGVLFSVYNLFMLGDIQRKHFLKVLAVRSYGLPATQILPL